MNLRAKSSQNPAYGIAILTLGSVVLTGLLLFRTMSGGEDKGPDSARIRASFLPATMSGFGDNGVFGYYRDGERVARCEYTWDDAGGFRNRGEVNIAGHLGSYETVVDVDTQGMWRRVSYYRPNEDTVFLDRRDGFVARSYGNRHSYLYPESGAIILGDWSPALFSLVAAASPSAVGQEDSLPILLLPGTVVEGVVKRLADRNVRVDGRSTELYGVALSYGEASQANIWTDLRYRVLYCELPAESAYFVREGYEELHELLRRGAKG